MGGTSCAWEEESSPLIDKGGERPSYLQEIEEEAAPSASRSHANLAGSSQHDRCIRVWTVGLEQLPSSA